MNKTIIIITSVLLVLILAVVVTAGVTKGFQDWDLSKKIEDKSEIESDDINEVATVSPARVLLSAGAAYVASDNVSVNKTLTASIFPFDAVDKTVDWSIAWGDAATRSSEPVTNYVEVIPQSDGSLTATVSCHQAFEGDIAIITVTTRAGGFSASCTVSFVGIPESLDIDVSEYNVVRDIGWNDDIVEMYCNSTYIVPILLENVFHHVGAEYANDYTIEIEACGSVNVKTEKFNEAGESTSTTISVIDLQASNQFDINQYCTTYFAVSGGLRQYLKAAISNGQLIIETGNAVASLYGFGVGRGGSAKMYFDSYVGNKLPYTKVTVTEKSTGISKTINIRTITSVQSVAISASSLTF